MNMVDERFEFAALIFRLVERPEYSICETDYQKEVSEAFKIYSKSNAVDYAKEISIGYDDVFKFSVHIEKNNGRFVFINDINSLFENNWNRENSKIFLELFNDFYIETNYSNFYESHIKLFENVSQVFFNEVYNKIDFEWFRKYVDPSNLRCIYSLSSGNYSAIVNNKIIYCLVMGDGASIVHEYCHSFANSIADKWYNDDIEFRKWCDESINLEKMPFYNTGVIIAREYVTRAYNIMYEVQHGAELNSCLSKERDHIFANSFKYMEQVYNKIL